MKSYIKDNKLHIYSFVLKTYLEYEIKPKKYEKPKKEFKYKCI